MGYCIQVQVIKFGFSLICRLMFLPYFLFNHIHRSTVNVYLNLSIFNGHHILIYSFTENVQLHIKSSRALTGHISWYHHFCAAGVNDVDMNWLHITILLGINWIQSDETKRCMRLHGGSSWKWWCHFVIQCMNNGKEVCCNVHIQTQISLHPNNHK